MASEKKAQRWGGDAEPGGGGEGGLSPTHPRPLRCPWLQAVEVCILAKNGMAPMHTPMYSAWSFSRKCVFAEPHEKGVPAA